MSKCAEHPFLFIHNQPEGVQVNEERAKKLVAMNAGILAAAALVSFILPMILDSMLEGRGNFIKAMAHVLPILAAIPFSCRLIAIASTPATSSNS